MALQTKNSVMALVKEVTEGTPVAPSTADEFVALQDGFSIEPGFAVLDNAELNGSIAKSKSVKGLEEPTASVSHYFRGSGVEATIPDYSLLLEACLGVAPVARATERDTIAASTVSVVKVDAGEGVEFQFGDAILAKHGSFVHEIRNVASVATDDLTLAQDLNNAPATGTNLGRNILWAPANKDHATISMWIYRGNDAAGAVELMAGSRSVSVSIEFPAGEFINASYSLEGIEFSFDPIEILAADVSFDFNDGGAQAGVLTAQMFKDPFEVAAALQTSMDGLSSDVITVVYDDITGKYTAASDGGVLSLLPATGPGTATEGWSSLGFGAADLTGSTSYTAATAIDKSAQFTPSFDSADPLVAKSNVVLLGPDAQDIVCFEASSVTVNIDNTKADILSVCSVTGKAGSVFSERVESVDISALLEDHQAEEFKNFRANDNMIFTYNAGEKSGGNWIPGKCMNVHMPTMVIDSFALSDSDGLVQLDMTLSAYTVNGSSEVFINQL